MIQYKHLLAAALLCLAGSVCAKIELPPMFSDNMVLQQQAEAPFWGKATPMKEVRITTSWDGKEYTTTADKNGEWKLTVKTPVAGGPYNVTLTDGKKMTLQNVMIGEVWICSGQSNMEMPVKGWGKVNNYQWEIDNANHPNIRLLLIDRNTSTVPMRDIKAQGNGWQVCSPTTIPEFSAAAYFFGRELAQKQNIAIGLIDTSWGGTIAEAWTSAESLNEMPYFRDAVKRVLEQPADKEGQAALYTRDLKIWENKTHDADKGFENGKAIWADAKLNDTQWKTMTFPGYIQKMDLPGFNGIVWIRRQVDIPSNWAGKEITLNLGTVDDSDITYFNGIEVGQTDNWMAPRVYKVPAKMVKAGKATLTIRIFDTGGDGGTNGDMYMTSANGEKISLNGPWKYQVSTSMREIGPKPINVFDGPNNPTVLYNAMIHPLVPYAIKGAIWYQGESNAPSAYLYRELFPMMIQDWRKQWKQDFPFYYVQLANFQQTQPVPSESDWAELREAQSRTLHLDNTGMAVIIDIGDANDIHPKNKQEVGRRLSLIARAKTYGEKIQYSGPMYRSYQIKGNKIILSFSHTEGGLKTKDGQALKGFAIAGRDHKFYWANAEIKGNKVIVSAPEVEFPVAVRYAWANNPVCNLYNGANLPASPFRTDDWTGVTEK